VILYFLRNDFLAERPFQIIPDLITIAAGKPPEKHGVGCILYLTICCIMRIRNNNLSRIDSQGKKEYRR
jgi:hypothetical protein